MSPDIIERVTMKIWPQKESDYSIDTLPQRWVAMEPVYRAERIREFQQQRSNDDVN